MKRPPAKIVIHVESCKNLLHNELKEDSDRNKTRATPSVVMNMCESINERFDKQVITVEKTDKDVTLKYEDTSTTIPNDTENRTYYFASFLWGIIWKPIEFVKKHF